MANEARIRELVAKIRINPEGWNQRNWGEKTECGTTMCATGLTCEMFGYELKWRMGIFSNEIAIDVDGGDLIPDTAQQLLDLTVTEASEIFYFTTLCDKCEGSVSTDHALDFGYDDHVTRHPTVEEFVTHISKVTGVEIKPETPQD